METVSRIPRSLVESFAQTIDSLDRQFAGEADAMVDESQDAVVRRWIDATNSLPWAGSGVTPDEWFFITTLYGEMTMDGQRTHIRRFFPLFVELAHGDMRAITPTVIGDWPLRSGWMKSRLLRMATILNERQVTMSEYVSCLRRLEQAATPANPMPALDEIVRDHRATGWKTLSVFVRDCVGGNCFPIDSRVAKVLRDAELPQDERVLVSLCLEIARNPREVARVFFATGGA
jgi:hypothetical protein